MLSLASLALGLALAVYLAFSKRLAGSKAWKATVVPLASIMGSGFLVSAPLLAGAVGNLALFCMAGLLALAYLVGDAIRFNIRHFEPVEEAGPGPVQRVAFLSRLVLAGAYFISVSYYLQLLAAFSLHATGIRNPLAAHGVTTVLLLLIGGTGIWKGLDQLEKLERFAVGLNLGAIAALLLGLTIYNLRLFTGGQWALASLPSSLGLGQVRVLLGLLIIVQGFETSRYLGAVHPAEQRIRTMRNAQLISSAIYLAFIALATVLFHRGLGSDVTAILQMAAPVSFALPILLMIAAIGSQFSASVADFSGSGGLLLETGWRKLSLRSTYGLALAATLVVTWATDVTQVIAYASRAFALFYALQGVVALLLAWRAGHLRFRRLVVAKFSLVTVLCLLVFLFGAPAG
jgi:hypothetical protein